MNKTVEICCGSAEDGYLAWQAGASRVEMNCALTLGGLTPSVGSVELLKKQTDLKVIAMLRPRGGGFFYSDLDYQQMLVDAVRLLDAGADGLTFACLTEKGEMDLVQIKTLVEIVHSYKGRQAVINRGFDMVKDPCFTLGSLAFLNVDRVLTSGGKATAWEGRKMIKTMQETYGEQIQILAAGGVTANNVKALMDYTGISQVHTSAAVHTYRYDPTTAKGETSYSYLSGKHALQYAVVDPEKVADILAAAGIEQHKAEK